ncbi:hypothetical protein ACFO0A_09455 [Novosphingobium tardum]|uniref:Uncharacterized protein n=1 Tax=Novosphingobium tardum TaxID=1538021 RepID=A0ABV8RQX6_9SPHN
MSVLTLAWWAHGFDPAAVKQKILMIRDQGTSLGINDDSPNDWGTG